MECEDYILVFFHLTRSRTCDLMIVLGFVAAAHAAWCCFPGATFVCEASAVPFSNGPSSPLAVQGSSLEGEIGMLTSGQCLAACSLTLDWIPWSARDTLIVI